MEKNKLKDKLVKFIEIVFGTKGNIRIKFGFSLFISGLLFFTFTVYFKDYENEFVYKTFSCISSLLFCFWMILISDVKTLAEFSIEWFRLLVAFFSFILCLYFCIVDCVNYDGFDLVIRLIGSCTVIVFCFFYLVSRFLDILIIIKNIVKKVKEKLFDSNKQSNSKIINLFENLTAFLVPLGGVVVAVKAIIIPLIELFRSFH